MQPRKPWTVMVYIAADNNLSTFGVDNLRQMKVAARENVNVLAEFDTGPTNKARRYFFDGRQPIGPIQDNVVDTFGPTNAADPYNLADFIVWGAENYPADHYFVVIWGHGGGVDDAFPHADDASFVPRHSLLSLFKGSPDDQPKGSPDDQPKGPPEGRPKNALNGQLNALFDSHLKEIGDVLKIGEDALLQALIGALKRAVSHALGQKVLGEIAKLHLNGKANRVFEVAQKNGLAVPQGDILDALVEDANNQFQAGALSSMRLAFLTALRRGILDGLRAGVLHELQIAVLHALEKHKDDSKAAIQDIRAVAFKALLQFLQDAILEAQKMDILDVVKDSLDSPAKSLAFVDHPQGFLTNLQLRDALQSASSRIGRKIDILGIDSCNMNMIEIGYELRNAVDFMVASQDNVPDASWPYDRLIHELVNQPYLSPQMLACATAITYVEAYSDYVKVPIKPGDPLKQDELVTLSVLNLERGQPVVDLIGELVGYLRGSLNNLKDQEALFAARNRVRTFGGGRFVDLLHLCRVLTGAVDDDGDDPEPPALPVDPAITNVANRLIKVFDDFVIKDRFSVKEKNCYGTSIYFPIFDPIEEPHQKQLAPLYSELALAKKSGWDKFVSDFLKQQKDAREVNRVLADGTTDQMMHVNVMQGAIEMLEKVKQASEATAIELSEVQKAPTTAAVVNGSLSGAERVAKAVSKKVKCVVDECTKNGD